MKIVIVVHAVGLDITVIASRRTQSIPPSPQVYPNGVSHRTFLCFEMEACSRLGCCILF